MGVPVLTLEGGHFVSRMGASFMIAAGLPDWVARDDADYVAKAVAVAKDLGVLRALKHGLRDGLLAQPGWDPGRYAEDFAVTLRKVWHRSMET